jgi:uncharacterized RDD family membrane protein YckC
MAPTAPANAAVEYAGIGARMVAGLLDSIILAVPIALVFGWGSTPGTGGFTLTVDYTMADAVETLVAWLYFACLQSGSWQGTIGMHVMGLRVVRDDDHQPISFGRATGRNFAAYLSAFILLIGYFMILFTKKRQALHDIISGTVVVKDAG